MAKEFPIQTVSFRGERDRFLSEGGGSKALPRWVDDLIISTNAQTVQKQLVDLSTLFSDRERKIPLLAEVTLNKKSTAKSHRPAIRSLLDVGSKRNVIGVTSIGKLLLKIDNSTDLGKIENNFHIMNSSTLSKNKKIGLAAVEGIEPYKVTIDENLNTKDLIKVQLVDYLNTEYNHRSLLALKIKCHDFNIEVEELNYASGLRLFSLDNVSKEALKAISSMDGVLSIRRMPTIEFEAAPDEANSNMEIMTPQQDVSYPIVGLLDSGVGNNDYLRPWMIDPEDNIAELSDGDINKGHGTAVASVINYGDFLENRNLTQCVPCRIQSCIVNTSPDRARIYENELVGHIQRAIEEHPNIKIWNLSQGIRRVIEDDKYSDFGMALDSLQKEHNILICKSAGNIESSDQNPRITAGADSLLSIVVGSIAHKKETKNDAAENDRSPFSRIGPGVENVVKPDLVHYGGNADTHMSLLSEWGRKFCLWSGTSFSTPRITSIAANLNYRIGGIFNPLLLKALLIHNSDYPKGLRKTADELRKEMGFGLPSSVTDILRNNEDECTMVFHHTLEKGSNVSSLDFPFPESLVENDMFIGKIKVTMATIPILNANQGCEYCQSQVDILLETYDHVKHVSLGENSILRNEERTSDDAVNILNPNFYSKKAFNKPFTEERMLIEQGDKYQPIKKYSVDLSNMTPTNKEKALGRNRKWALKLIGLYRDASEQSLLRDGEVLSQEVIVVVTITDPKHRGFVYSECLKLLELRGYTHNDIDIHTEVQIENG